MDDDLKYASKSMHDNSERSAYTPVTTKKTRRNYKLLLITAAACIMLVASGLSLWKFVSNKPESAVVNTATDTVSTPIIKSDVPISAATETYQSTALSVSFKYPKSWKATEAAGGIRIESPGFTYNAINLGDVEGNFRIYIRQGARNIDGSYIGKGIAIKPSEKLVYTQPAIGQREDTLLSFFGSETFESFSFFLIAGNFQLNLGDTLGPDYGKEPDAYIIAGGYSTGAAVDDLATRSVPLDYYSKTNVYKQAIAIIASLQVK